MRFKRTPFRHGVPYRRAVGLVGLLAISVASVLTFTVSPAGALTGAVYTTESDCASTNANIYASKSDVHLNGGPNGGGSGLPDGEYYVRVTSPNGTLLGTSVGAADETPAKVDDGSFETCYNLMAILIRASDSSPGFDNTPNNGNEYKVWVSATSAFSDNATDNFKALPETVTEPTEVTPAASRNSACGEEDTYTVEAVPGVTYKVDGNTVTGTNPLPAGETVVITVVLADDHVLADGAPSGFELTGQTIVDCPTVTPAAVTITRVCDVIDTYTIPMTPGVAYKIGDDVQLAGDYPLADGDTVTIVAVATGDDPLHPDADDTWSFTGQAIVDCPTVTPTPANITRSCGLIDVYEIVATSGVAYKIGDDVQDPGFYPLPAGEEVTIVAVATGDDPLDDGEHSWTFTGQSVRSCGGIIVTTPTTQPPTTTTVPPTTTTTEPEGEGETVGETIEIETTTTAPELAFTADPAPVEGELPRTGSGILTLALFGFGIMALGFVLIASGRDWAANQ